MTEYVTTEPGPSLMLPLHGACHAEVERLRGIVKDLERQIAEHHCALPPSIQEALNSGDGSYRP